MLPIPQKLLVKGVRDMVRISDSHERHSVRCVCPARVAGIVRRWAAGAGAGWRFDRVECRGTPVNLNVGTKS